MENPHKKPILRCMLLLQNMLKIHDSIFTRSPQKNYMTWLLADTSIPRRLFTDAICSKEFAIKYGDYIITNILVSRKNLKKSKYSD